MCLNYMSSWCVPNATFICPLKALHEIFFFSDNAQILELNTGVLSNVFVRLRFVGFLQCNFYK